MQTEKFCDLDEILFDAGQSGMSGEYHAVYG